MENTEVHSQLFSEKDAALQGCKLFTVIRIRQQPNQQRLSGNDNYLGNDRSARQAVNNAFFSPSLQEKLPSCFLFWAQWVKENLSQRRLKKNKTR